MSETPDIDVRRQAPIAFGLALAATLAWAWVMRGKLIDDAFITFANARTFAEGAGLALQPGDRVESASSTLWALLLAPFTQMPELTPFAAKGLGGLCLLLALLQVWALMRRLPGGQGALLGVPAPLVALGIAAICAPVGIWSYYGMENGLVMALLLGAVLALLRAREAPGRFWRDALPALPIALLYMSRPEAFGLVAILAGWDLLCMRDAGGIRTLLRRWLPAAAVIAGYEIVGFLFYGAWLPTSAVAKLDGGLLPNPVASLRYLLFSAQMLGAGILPAGLVLGGIALAGPAGLRRASLAAIWRECLADRLLRALLLICMLLAGQIAFIFLAGGDWMPFSRFASHLLPLAACAMVCGLMTLASGALGIWFQRQARSLAVLCFVGLLVSQAFGLSVWLPRMNQLLVSEQRALDGLVERLRSCVSPDTVLAVADIGRVAWRFEGRVLDWWGLADRAITDAGESSGRIRPETLLARAPDYVVLYANARQFGPGTVGQGMAGYSVAFAEHAAFRAAYVWRFSLEFDQARWHAVLQRRDLPPCPVATG